MTAAATRRLNWIAPLAAAAGLAACQPVAEAAVQPASLAQPEPRAPLPRIVATSCQGCHAVRPHLDSPNPAAPSFVAIANIEGLTPNTLGAFLRDAHNYPDEMQMTLTKNEVAEVTRYILTLVDPNYRPIP